MMPQAAAKTSRVPDLTAVGAAEPDILRLHAPRPAIASPAPTGGSKPVAYLKYRWVMMLFLGGFLASVFGYTAWRLIPVKYTTNALIRVYSNEQVHFAKENAQERSDFNIYLKSQGAMIKSNFVLTAALRDPNIAALPMLREQSDPVRYLEEELKIESPEGSEILKVSLSGDDPKAIAQIVNATMDAFFRDVVEEEVTRKKTRLKQLEDSITRMQADVSRRNDQIKKEDGGKPESEAMSGLTTTVAVNQLIRMKEMLAKIENDSSGWEAEKAILEKKLANVADEVPPPPSAIFEKLDSEFEVQELKRKIEKLKSRIEYLIKLSNDPNLSSVVELRQRVTEAQQDLDRMRSERIAAYQKSEQPVVEKKLKNELERAKAMLGQLAIQKKNMQEGMEEYQKSINQSGPGDSPLPFPVIDVRERTNIITQMMDKANLLRLEVNAPPRVSEFQRATPPLKRDLKKQILGTIAAGLFGFGLVGMGVIVYESRVRRVLSLTDVQAALLGPIAGVWPSRQHAGDAAQEALAEAAEKTRVHLLQQFSRPGGKIIAVTSALTEENKAFLAWQLARSFARSGSRTLLIDFDLRAPSLHRWLQLKNERGACELLCGQVDFRDVLLPQGNGLTFLPAGKWAPEVRAGLTSERVEALMAWLRQQFDAVVLNTHPLLHVAETLLLCRNADGILLSVERHESRLPLTARAHEKLAMVASEAFGMVYQGATAEECFH
jgi:polysaccharide biosynthesis transport protein